MATWKERETEGVTGKGIGFWDSWIDGTRLMRQWIDDDARSVLDLGAGNMRLRTMLPDGTAYYPVDYTKRSDETLVCDFNKHEFPDKAAEVCYCGGILEYVEDADWFIEKIRGTGCKMFLLSYCIKLENQTIEQRRGAGYVNDFSFRELLDIVQSHGFVLADWNKHYDFGPMLKFVPASPVSLQQNYFCTGCGACANVCPKDALSMRCDEAGFLKPALDESLCVKCGKCTQICPVLRRNPENDAEPEAFACMADDETRKSSSSGGAFSMLAREAFGRGGIVFGAAWEPDFSVRHAAAENEAELARLRKSKYLQSDIGKTFRMAKDWLDKGRLVVFSGTPCQIAGLRSFLGKDYDNLLAVDILCHYATSPKAFKKYLDENFGAGNVRSYMFRPKERGWNCSTTTTTLMDGTVLFRDESNDLLLYGFHRRLYINETCEKCKFADYPRAGDITLGDYWDGARDPHFNDGKGTSEIILNTKKGAAFFASVRERFPRCESIPIERTYANGIKNRRPAHPEQAHFLKLLEKNSFNFAAERALGRKFQIGLVGNYTGGNYGASLTYYALYQTLTEQLGYDVLLIERPKNAPWGPYESPNEFMKVPYPRYAMEPCADKIQMKRLNERCDIFFVGSDQGFNNFLYHRFGKFIDLDWVRDNKPKIAYAASFGHDSIWGSDYDRAKMSLFMKKFDAFSVRERSGVALAKTEFGVDAVHVLDPVFLCPKEKYVEMAKLGGFYELSKEKFLFNYILDLNDSKIDAVKRASGILRIPHRIITDIAKQTQEDKSKWQEKAEVVYKTSAENWLAEIICCEYMITDSFHGMCFAILFHKPFVAIVNKGRGATRFESILTDAGLTDRAVDNPEQITESLLRKEIDWEAVEEKLRIRKEESLSWLKIEHHLSWLKKESF